MWRWEQLKKCRSDKKGVAEYESKGNQYVQKKLRKRPSRLYDSLQPAVEIPGRKKR